MIYSNCVYITLIKSADESVFATLFDQCSKFESEFIDWKCPFLFQRTALRINISHKNSSVRHSKCELAAFFTVMFLEYKLYWIDSAYNGPTKLINTENSFSLFELVHMISVVTESMMDSPHSALKCSETFQQTMAEISSEELYLARSHSQLLPADLSSVSFAPGVLVLNCLAHMADLIAAVSKSVLADHVAMGSAVDAHSFVSSINSVSVSSVDRESTQQSSSREIQNFSNDELFACYWHAVNAAVVARTLLSSPGVQNSSGGTCFHANTSFPIGGTHPMTDRE